MLILCILSVLSSLVTFASDEGYVYWCSDDRIGNSSPESREYFASNKYKKGSRVRLTVNGISKEYTVNESLRDKNACCAVSVSDAKSMGFYYVLKEACSVDLIQDAPTESSKEKSEWYDITGLKSAEGNVCDLVRILNRRGYKTEVDPNDFTVSVRFIPEYLVEHEAEAIKDVIHPSSDIQIIKTNVIL